MHLRLLALLLSLLTVVAGCTVGPSRSPAIAARPGDSSTPSSAPPAPVPPLENPQSSTLNWTDCTAETATKIGDLKGQTFSCVTVNGTLDPPSRPGRGGVRLSLLKAGTGSTPLVVSNDITGEPGTVYAARLALSLPPEILSRFAVIGIDRRGSGESNPVTCLPRETRVKLASFDTSITELRGLGKLVDAAREASQECVLDLDERLPAYDTWRAAGDLDLVRERLGAHRLNALGHGEGSRVLGVFAQRYPEAIGRFVLDGAVDPLPDPSSAAETRAQGAEQTFDAFATDCVLRGCPLGAEPRKAVTTLLEQLRGQPLTSPDGISITNGLAARTLLNGLANRQGWPALADALAKAGAGDGSGLGTLIRPYLSSETGPAGLDPGLATGCNDTATRLPPEKVAGLATQWRGKHPLFGVLVAQQLLWCSAWPVPARPLPVIQAAGSPPVVVISTLADPVTPQPGTTRAAEQLSSGVQVKWQGAGHGAIPTSPCATAAAQRFLVDGVAPKSGTVCPP
ncbi:alpha/beta hydrolase [Pseudonocardiaceae bacterium YIM PH 21723]|nr:alpha/beta hydrolase [Pseudonocardiaceae bacterium YIM PH 21723]